MDRRLTVVVCMFFSIAAFAQQPLGPGAKLVWDLSPELDIQEYQLFSAATSGAQDLAGIPIATIAHPTSEWTIDTEGTHFVVATAVDRFGNDSPPSNEVSFDFNSSPPAAPLNLRMVFSDGTVVVIMRDRDGNVLEVITIPAPEQE